MIFINVILWPFKKLIIPLIIFFLFGIPLIYDIPDSSVTVITYIGIVFDYELFFHIDIESTCCRALKMHGLVQSFCDEFKLVGVLNLPIILCFCDIGVKILCSYNIGYTVQILHYIKNVNLIKYNWNFLWFTHLTRYCMDYVYWLIDELK